jgi:glycosyltransferase involved in cell wall biosynthesis
MTEHIIPENWIPIEGASHYALTDDDYVYNLKTDKKLKRYWSNLKHHSYVTDDEGAYRLVNHDNPSVARHGLPDEEFVVVSDYPDYKVTPYGAVWKFQKTGNRHRGNPFLVHTKDFGKKEYVRLKTEDGRAHWVRMEKIMEEAYPND